MCIRDRYMGQYEHLSELANSLQQIIDSNTSQNMLLAGELSELSKKQEKLKAMLDKKKPPLPKKPKKVSTSTKKNPTSMNNRSVFLERSPKTRSSEEESHSSFKKGTYNKTMNKSSSSQKSAAGTTFSPSSKRLLKSNPLPRVVVPQEDDV
eukprot:TRINITY_DN21039_c0_g1_i1.p1 TRINITY_DN21039_c0_g1~~TRINITY_DN21039_c0_g1_i1.p1  ORF type:complete len:151 (+),score=35.49 TRINITY_DN21039_c0_g1_i1:68-520(+)